MSEDRITAAEAQKHLGVSGKTMARLLKSGELPFERDKLDRRIKLVRRADVERLAAESARKGKEAA
jgi:excisionase family DNA binding protein